MSTSMDYCDESGAGSLSEQWLVQQVAETCPRPGWVGALAEAHRFSFCFRVGAHLRGPALDSKAPLRAGFQSGTLDCRPEDTQKAQHMKEDGQGTEQEVAGHEWHVPPWKCDQSVSQRQRLISMWDVPMDGAS